MQTKWSQDNQVAITICDTEGIVLSINDKAAKLFKKWGGLDLIGRNLLDCHSENAGKKILELISSNQSNCYTIEKNGVKSLLFQTPWYEGGKVMGLIEYCFDLPPEVPHYNRD